MTTSIKTSHTVCLFFIALHWYKKILCCEGKQLHLSKTPTTTIQINSKQYTTYIYVHLFKFELDFDCL